MILLVFAATLIVAAFLSDLFSRSVLSAAVLFFGVGLVLAFTGAVDFSPQDERFVLLVESTLFVVLFTDAMQIGLSDLRGSWRLPGRALLLGMPLVFAATALVGMVFLDATWLQVLLIAAVLAPTDPILVGAITSREPVPYRLRHILAVESGVNDGLALPAVLFLLAALSETPSDLPTVVGEAGLGVLIGVAVPALVLWLRRVRWTYSPAGNFDRLLGIAIGIAVFGLARWSGGNEFLAAFAAGVTVRSFDVEFTELLSPIGDVVSEMVKLFGLLVFASVIEPSLVTQISWTVWLFAVLVLVAARPVGMLLALTGSDLGPAERLTVAWFGPKGFATVFLALLVLQSGIPNAKSLYGVITVVIGLSIVVHSSTDVLVARYFGRRAEAEAAEETASVDDGMDG